MRRCRRQVALYQGADREKILIEGAKREGQFTLYTSHTWFKTFVKEFEKKYPFVRAAEWRDDSADVISESSRNEERAGCSRDVVETTAGGIGVMRNREGIFQEYFSPEPRYFTTNGWPEEKAASSIGRPGDLQQPGFQHQSHFAGRARRAASKTCSIPKWKGKMAIAGTTTGARWIGDFIESQGREF